MRVATGRRAHASTGRLLQQQLTLMQMLMIMTQRQLQTRISLSLSSLSDEEGILD